uniref:NAC domain-containing protein n=1 Tax=Populus davidiana TaxID=266767 RepID=A0A6M2EAC2_9ROSI
MAGHTKKNIGVMKTLAFYKKARPKDVRTGWMIYEFDIVTNSSLSKKGQYVLCRLENRSDERIKKGEQNHLMASVSVSEAVPGQSMTSDSENQNSSEMVVSLASDDSELNHHVGSDSGNQNSSELTPARLVSELSHYMASDFRNQNSCKTGSNLAYGGSGWCHSTAFNSETQYLNQPTVGSVCIVNKNHQNPNELLTVDSVSTVSKNHYMAFDLENQNPNELPTVDSVYTVSNNHYMAFDSEYQNPNELLTAVSAYIVDKNHYMAFDSEYQKPNELLTADSVYDVSESQYMPFDSENQNLNNINSISTYESSLMASHGFENKNPPFPLGGECGTSVVMPFKFINQSTYDESEPSSLLAPDFGNQNLDKEINLPAFDEGEWSSLTAIPSDFGNENPSKKADISTHEEGYLTAPFSENNLADVSLPDVSSELLPGALEAIFEQKKSPITVLQPPVCVEESHSYMDYDTSTST